MELGVLGGNDISTQQVKAILAGIELNIEVKPKDDHQSLQIISIHNFSSPVSRIMSALESNGIQVCILKNTNSNLINFFN